jgi:hypothetical protein
MSNDQDNSQDSIKSVKQISSSISATFAVTESISVALLSLLSINHIQAATLFARQTFKIEEEHGSKFQSYTTFTSEFSEEMSAHRSYVIGAIYASTAFLEATINEFYFTAADNPDEIAHIGKNVIQKMSGMWADIQSRKNNSSILNKFKKVLDWCGYPSLNESTFPYSDAKLLVDLRNALTHYKPEWATMSASTPQKFESDLSGRFQHNRLMSTGNPFFPDKALGHGCAEWAVSSSIAFADDFFTRVGVKPTFDHVRASLNTR